MIAFKSFWIRTKKAPQERSFFVLMIRIVPKVGVEPTHPRVHDFESCASTNSATLAFSAFKRSPKSCKFNVFASPKEHLELVKKTNYFSSAGFSESIFLITWPEFISSRADQLFPFTLRKLLEHVFIQFFYFGVVQLVLIPFYVLCGFLELFGKLLVLQLGRILLDRQA